MYIYIYIYVLSIRIRVMRKITGISALHVYMYVYIRNLIYINFLCKIANINHHQVCIFVKINYPNS